MMGKLSRKEKLIINDSSIYFLNNENHIYINPRQLLSIQINLTNKCFQKCIGCRKYQWPKDNLDYIKVLELLNSIRHNKHNFSVVFSGGEPTSHKNFNDIIKHCNKFKIPFGVLTSAIWLKNFDYKLMVKYADYISISLDGHNIESYIKIRGVNHFSQAIRNIKKMIKYKNKIKSKVRIRINSTITKFNYEYIKNIYDLCENELGIDCNFFPAHTWNNIKLENDMLNNNLGSDIKFNKKIINFISNLNRTKTKTCIIHFLHAFIDSNGDVFFCCRMADDNGDYKNRNKKYILGNIYKDNFFDIYYSNKANKLRKKILNNPKEKPCLNCDRYYNINKEYNEFEENKNKELFL